MMNFMSSSLVFINQLLWRPEKEVNKNLFYLSGTRGAKHDVVEWTHSTFSAPSSSILRSTASKSVRNSSPSRTFSTTTGSKPDQTVGHEQETATAFKCNCVCFYSTRHLTWHDFRISEHQKLFLTEKCCHISNQSSLWAGCKGDRPDKMLISPAVTMALKQDFWSMRGQMM